MASEERLKKIETVNEAREKGFVVVLENVHDPHNAEAVLRSCDAFGVKDVCFVFENVPGFNPKKVGKKTSGSANKWLDFRNYNSIESCLEDLKKDGYKIAGTVLSPAAESIFDAKFTEEKIALVFGNEHSGLSKKAISLCDRLLTIPMVGMVQSLNISVSAALFIYEVVRERRLR